MKNAHLLVFIVFMCTISNCIFTQIPTIKAQGGEGINVDWHEMIKNANSEILSVENNQCLQSIQILKASSTLSNQGRFNYNVQNLNDGDVKTAWVEGNTDYGVGEYFEFFSCGINRIYNGYQFSPQKWYENSRVKRLKVYRNNIPLCVIELTDEMGCQKFVIPNHTITDKTYRWKLEIVDVYKGLKWKDVAISEIIFSECDYSESTIIEEKKNLQLNTIRVEKSDVDFEIPLNNTTKKNTYALIIGNEDYSANQTGIGSEVNVLYAENDARTFYEYCLKTMGIPEKNITLIINGTGSKMLQNIDLISQIVKASNGNAEIIFYYAGHGLPDELTKEPYIIPVDVSGNDLKYAIKLMDVYRKLTEFPSLRVTVFLDACFSGGARNESLLALRGVKIKPKESVFDGNLVVFTSSSGNESSAPYKEKNHGMFTYFLLKKIQESRGNCTYQELEEYLEYEVSVNSLVINKKQQTPQVIRSPEVEQTWRNWKLN